MEPARRLLGEVIMTRFLSLTLLVVLWTRVDSRGFVQERELGPFLSYLCVHPTTQPEEHDVPVIMLHGLTDTKETWDGIYQTVSLLTNRKVCIYDARNHGDSPWNDIFNVNVLAQDLGSFMRFKNIEKAILVGHSMGGLTIMKFALESPDKVAGLFVEDISPRIPEDISANILAFLKLLQSSLSSIPDDADEETAIQAIKDYMFNATGAPAPLHMLRKFPLVRPHGRWQWRSNFQAFITSLSDPDSFVGKMEGQYNGKVLFIYGGDSPFKVGDDKEANRKIFPNADFVAVEGAGHGIHPEFPQYLSVLLKFLESTKSPDGHLSYSASHSFSY